MKSLIVATLLCIAFSAHAESPPQFLFQWGGSGSGEGQFNLPMDLAADSFGNIYVVEKYNHRVQKFTSRGEFILTWGAFGANDGQFSGPEGLCVDNVGNIYVVDTDNDRVQKFTPDGTFIRKWGTTGSAPGQFSRPVAIAADDIGGVYVSDYENMTIQKFDSTGAYVLTFDAGYGGGYYPCDGLAVSLSGLVYATAVDIATEFVNVYTTDGAYENAFGCSGSYPTPCAMSHPNDVTVDENGNIYVVDNDWYRVVKWSPDLQVLYTCTTHGGSNDNPYGIAVNRWGWVYVTEQNGNNIQVYGIDFVPEDPPVFVLEWGMPGSGQGQFNQAAGVDYDAEGNIFVVDIFNHRVQKFSPYGEYLDEWGQFGTAPGQFNEPYDVAIGQDGYIYVTDGRNDRVQKFDSAYTYQGEWGTSGSDSGQFRIPLGVDVDSENNVYVSDTYNFRIQKFTSNGDFLTMWGSEGSGPGQFEVPQGLSVGPGNVVYVADYANHRIQEFASNGDFITNWGSFGAGNGQFNEPYGVAVGPDSAVYVTDVRNHRVQKFGGAGEFLTKWGSIGSGQGYFHNPAGVCVDANNDIYVGGPVNNNVQRFSYVTSGISISTPFLQKLNLQTRPNPIGPRTSVVFMQPTHGNASLDLLDIQGRLIERLIDRRPSMSGWNDIPISPSRSLPTGTYFLRLTVGNQTASQKIIIVR